MSIAEKARNKSLTRKDLDNLASGDMINELEDGNTPLGYSVLNGDIRTIRLLIEHKASVQRKAANGLSLLHMAVDAKENAVRVALILLQIPTINLNEEDETYPYDTPLIRALKNNPDPVLVKAFKDHGASTTTPNAKGETAEDIADRLLNIKVKEALVSQNEDATDTSLSRFVFAAAYMLIDYLRPYKRVKNSIVEAFRMIYNVIVKPEIMSPIPMYPRMKKDLEDILNDAVASEGLESFFPSNSEVLENILIKAHTVLNDHTINLHLTRSQVESQFKLALYQPVIYCDDSESMQTENRAQSQADIVSFMSELMLLFSPEDKGVHLRFIHHSSNDLDNLKGDTLRKKMDIGLTFGTPIGTNLHEKILEPFIYNTIRKGQEPRFLIIVITDGCPYGEDPDAFKNAIATCRQRVLDANYPPYTVKFNVNQVGNAPEASAFLDALQTLRTQPDFRDVLHITADKLDMKYNELRDKKDTLEDWLRQTLTR